MRDASKCLRDLGSTAVLRASLISAQENWQGTAGWVERSEVSRGAREKDALKVVYKEDKRLQRIVYCAVD